MKIFLAVVALFSVSAFAETGKKSAALVQWMSARYECADQEKRKPRDELDFLDGRYFAIDLRDNPQIYFMPVAHVEITGRQYGKEVDAYAEEDVDHGSRLRVFMGAPGTDGKPAVTMFYLERSKDKLPTYRLRFVGTQKVYAKGDTIPCTAVSAKK